MRTPEEAKPRPQERRDLQALGSELDAICFGDTMDKAPQSEASQIAAHGSREVVLGVNPEQGCEMAAQLCRGIALDLHAEHHQRVEQGLGAGLAKGQRGGTLIAEVLAAVQQRVRARLLRWFPSFGLPCSC
jgi:hypothetical protein